MKSWQPWHYILLGIFFGLLTSAVIFLVAFQPRGKPVTLDPLPSPSLLVVQISGAVKQPGVYSLPRGSRLQDGVKAAGGVLPEADLTKINQAGVLTDGQNIVVPKIGEIQTPPQRSADNAVKSTPGALVNINTAAIADLMTLPGIGEDKAQRILQFREQNGPFTSIDQLLNIEGIGAATLEKLKPLVTIEN